MNFKQNLKLHKITHDDYCNQRRIHNSVKYLKWSFLQKQLMTEVINYLRKKPPSDTCLSGF